jgi:hypothetical protein
MQVKLIYNGIQEKKATWTCMGKLYSYNLIPGQIIMIPENQVKNLKGFGSFQLIKEIQPMVEVESTEIISEIDEEIFEKQIEETVNIPEEEDPFKKYEEEVKDTQEDKIEDIEEIEVENTEVEESPDFDYTSLSKAELKRMCKERGLKTSGNRDDLIYRNVQFDVDNV